MKACAATEPCRRHRAHSREAREIPATIITLLAAALLLTITAGTSSAEVIQVTTFNDELNTNDNCSVREALAAANSDLAVDACPAGNGTDSVILAAGTYMLSIGGDLDDMGLTGDLDIFSDLTLAGQGAGLTTIQGDGTDRVVQVLADSVVNIEDLTLTGGHEFNLGGGGLYNSGTLTLRRSTVDSNMSSAGGGGIRNDGSMTIYECTVSGNEALVAFGGGIDNVFGGVLTVENSTITGNVASAANGNGGGIDNFSNAVLTIINSTISTNFAALHGGGIYHLPLGTETATILHTTVAFNEADIFGTSVGTGGGLYNEAGTFVVRNSLVADNSNAFGGAPDCGGSTFESQGFNLIQNMTGCALTFVGSDILGFLADLDPTLAANSGATDTHALMAGSLAIDAIPGGVNGCDASRSADQRSFVRARGGGAGGAGCEIGAYEAGTALSAPIFADGFESGNVSVWSTSVP